MALFAAPGAALAQDECGAQAGTTPIVCDQTSYANGVTYDADGDLFIDFTASPTVEIESGGISLTGDGSESINFDSASTNTEIESRDLTGALVDVLTENGDIDILTEELDADGQNPAGVTHGIRAVVTGTGGIDIENVGAIDALGNSNPVDSIGIEATATSGDIALSINDNVQGNGQGVLATTTTGRIDIDQTDGSIFGPTGSLTAISDSGDIDIRVSRDDPSQNSSPSANVMTATTAGDITVFHAGNDDRLVLDSSAGSGLSHVTQSNDNDRPSSLSGDGEPGLDATIGDGGLILDITGVAPPEGEGLSNTGEGPSSVEGVTVRGAGAAEVNIWRDEFYVPGPAFGDASEDIELVNQFARLEGDIDFSDLDGGASINVGDGGVWLLTTERQGVDADTITWSESADSLHITPGGYLFMEPREDRESVLVMTFGGGEDLVRNEGRVIVGTSRAGFSGIADNDGELRLEGLERFENAGSIYLGAYYFDENRSFGSSNITEELFRGLDGQPDDILSLPDAVFHGENGSRIAIDTDFNTVGTQVVGQSSCNHAARGADGNLAADCVNLENGGATGRTLLIVNDRRPGDRGAYNPDGLMVVDVSNGDPADIDPNAFGIAPESVNYDPNSQGVDKGLFLYTVGYDADAQQFGLYGVEGPGSQQFPLLAQSTTEVWRASAASWLDRRADQRGRSEPASGGAWGNVTRREAERDAIHTAIAGTTPVEFDNSHEQSLTAITVGRDWLFGAGEGAWLVGAMAGYARGDVEYDNYPNDAKIEGPHAGIYGSYMRGPFFVDAVVNGLWSKIDNDIPIMNLQPEGTIISTDASSYGAQLEAGWRLPFGPVQVEPLAGVAYATSSFDDLNVPAADTTRVGGDVKFDRATSLRTSLGARVRMDNVIPGFVPTAVSLTAKAIHESDGDAVVNIENIGPTATVANTFDGTFAEVTGSISVTNTAKTVAGYLNVEGLFESDYESVGLTAGFRYQW